MTNTNLEERLQHKESTLTEKIVQGFRNWAIDTSAKVGVYAPLMATMEAHNGLEGEQIIQSRAAAALVDVGVARVYTKVADYLADKYKIDLKKGGLKACVLDTVAMVSTYTPVYAGILATTGADAKQISYSLLMGAGIATATSRPFRKYVLTPWRKLCGFKKTTKIEKIEEVNKVEVNPFNGTLDGGWW
ncbi:MAG: L-alanine exporter AlaE [Candidatus Woesearchaeota archaeon]|nr:L-alanine exporter AlaE [Candidatus Woesearchaeota archaeon]